MPAPAPAALATSSDPTLERSFRGHTGAVHSVSFNASCTQLASGGADHSVRVWNFKPTLRSFKYKGHSGPVYSVAFSPDGSLLASASGDGTLRVWQPTVRGPSRCVRAAHSGAVRSVAWSADGTLLLTAGDDKSCKLWHAGSLRFVASFTGHTNWIRSAALSNDGRLLVSASDDSTVRLYDTSSRQLLHVYSEHTPGVSVRCVAFHPSGTLIASLASDGAIHIVDVRTHELLQHYAAHNSTNASNDEQTQVDAASGRSLAFHPSGNYLLSVGDDALVKVWSLCEGLQLYTIHAHRSSALGVALSHDGHWFATCGADSRVLVWRTNFDQPGATATRADETGMSAKQRRLLASPTKHQFQQQQREQERDDASSPDLTHPTQHPELDMSYNCTYTHAHTNPAKHTHHAYAEADAEQQQENEIGSPMPPPPHPAAAYNLNNAVASPVPAPPQHSPPQQQQQQQSRNSARNTTSSHDIQQEFASHAFKHNRSAQQEQAQYRREDEQDARAARLAQQQQRQHASHHEHHQASASVPRRGLMSSAVTPVALPPEVASTLQHIVSQLDLVTRTLGVLDERMHSHETKVAQLESEREQREKAAFRKEFLAKTSKQPQQY